MASAKYKSKVKRPPRKPPAPRRAALAAEGPVTLEQARALVRASAPRRALGAAAPPAAPASPETLGLARERLAEARRREQEQSIREYRATLEIMKRRGVEGLTPGKAPSAFRRAPVGGSPAPLRAPTAQPLQILAEGDSWFKYPVPLFGGGIIPRLENRVGVPILNLAKAGDEVRFMLGVEERKIMAQHLSDGCPAGGPWDVLLFSGGGNDIVDNPMALWIRDFSPNTEPRDLIHQARFQSALDLVRAGYEDLITLRDSLSPSTHLLFHAYDFAIPDGRGICHLGPWLKPTFDVRKFPLGGTIRFEVVKAMLRQFAVLLQSLAARPAVTFLNGQGTLPPKPSSWHNELHPSKAGFEEFADLFHAKLKALFPARVL